MALEIWLRPIAFLLWVADLLLWVIAAPLGVLRSTLGGRRHRRFVVGSRLTNTVHDLIRNSSAENSHRNALGSRKITGFHTPPFGYGPSKLKILAQPIWASFEHLSESSEMFGRGLLALGLDPLPLEVSRNTTESWGHLEGPHCIVLLGESSVEWLTCSLGAMSQSISVATVFPGTNLAHLAAIINALNARVLFCGEKSDAISVASLARKCPSLKTIISTSRKEFEASCVVCDESHAHSASSSAPKAVKGKTLPIFSVNDVIELGRCNRSERSNTNAPSPEHLALIMYSGSEAEKPRG